MTKPAAGIRLGSDLEAAGKVLSILEKKGWKGSSPSTKTVFTGSGKRTSDWLKNDIGQIDPSDFAAFAFDDDDVVDFHRVGQRDLQARDDHGQSFLHG